MNKLSLRFLDKETEDLYISAYKERFYVANRVALSVSIFMLLIFISLEFTVFGEKDKLLFFIKFIILAPSGIITILLTYLQSIKKYVFYLYGITLAVASIGFAFMIFHKPEELFSPSLLGLIMFYIFAFTLIRITFLRTFIIMVIVYLGFVGYIFISQNISDLNSFSSWFFLGTCLLFSAFAGYYFEFSDRNNYMNNLDLSKKNIEYKELQALLEQNVEDRTKELQITNQKLEIAVKKAEESDSLKSNFLATISHEIRTPLTSILGFSQLIAKAKTDPEKQRKYIDILEESTEQLLQIITNILSLSEIQSERLEISHSVIQCKYLARKIEELAHTTLKKHQKNLHFHTQYEDHLPFKIAIGENEFENILMHLLDNAVKYTSVGEFGFSCKINKQNFFEVCIYDSGIGIKHDQEKNIFDFFRQIDQNDTRKYSGIGVGLSICKGYITNSGGSIWVDTNTKNGARFYFTIPIIEE